MNKQEAALNKVSDLERYVNKLARRFSAERSNSVVFFQSKATVGLSKVFNFSFEASAETSIFLDLSAAFSGFSGDYTIAISVNNVLYTQKRLECTSNTSLRMAFSLPASFGENQIDVALASDNDNFVLDNLTLVLSGVHLLNKAASLVFGLKNQADDSWMFGEAKNNTLNLVSQTLLSSVSVKTFDFSIDDLFLSTIEDKNFAFLIAGGGLYSVALDSSVQTKKLHMSVSSAAIGHIGQTSTLFVVCRNRLFKREIDKNMKTVAVVPTNLNANERVLRVATANVNQQSFVLCVQTATKIYIYLVDEDGFQLFQTLSETGLCNCIFSEDIFVSTSNLDITRIFAVDFQTKAVSAGKNLGSFDNFFQISKNQAVTSKDNLLSILNF